eukprot:04627.XXX_69002_69109_1 [CDS] Oithona nana genome sequencing.
MFAPKTSLTTFGSGIPPLTAKVQMIAMMLSAKNAR